MESTVDWYVPVSQAADMLGCHCRQVRELIDRGVLARISLPPNRIRVSKASVVNYLLSTQKSC